MLRITFALALITTIMTATHVRAGTTIIWVGGDGPWYTGTGVWDDGGGPTSALGAFGRTSGWRNTEGTSCADVYICGPGTVVYYNGDTVGDFRWRANSNAEGGSITICDGATFNMESTVATDSAWMQFDAARFTVTDPGSLFNRYNTSNIGTGAALNGGAMIFGSWKGYSDPAGQNIDLEVLNGGEIRNKGQTWFGAYGDEDLLNATLTIGANAKFSNNGALENGISLDNSAGAGNEGEFNFIYSAPDTAGPHAHNYKWDFTGHAGQVVLGEEGVRVQVNNGATWSSLNPTYENLWNGVATGKSSNDTILHHSGINSSTGGPLLQFEDYFKVTGSNGSADYTLESIAGILDGGTAQGDLNLDGNTDAADFGILAGNFGSVATHTSQNGDINWTAASGTGGDDLVDAADIGVMFAGWTGDHPPAFPGTATAHYDPATGEIEVDVNGVVNWYIERTGSQSMTGDSPVGLPGAAGLVTDNDTRIGESAFAPFAYSQSLGNVAATGLANDGNLRIYWNPSLGGRLISASVSFVPEPTTLALASLALCGVMATRRRRLA